MKLSYREPNSAGPWIVFADEADRVTTLEVCAPQFQPQVQVDPLFRAASPSIIPRGNTAATLSIGAAITYGSLADALASRAEVFALFVNKRVHLKVEKNDTEEYHPNAVLTGYTPQLTGVTVRHGLQFLAQSVTTTEPS